MTKTIYTERDIEDLSQRGLKSIVVNDDVILTMAAREKAEKIGVALVEQEQRASQTAPSVIRPGPAVPPATLQSTLRKRVKTAVVAQLGNEVNPKLLDTIINRVSDNLGIK
ncbi:MAG: hypothetical protein QGD88_10170 [Anaerolineae bacterium]|nr:hypothetical protein [Anaerolineae bacterium]